MKETETVTLPKHIAEFLFRAYFDLKDENNILAAIKRAYRDLNRTLIGLPVENERINLRKKWNELLKGEIENVLLNKKFENWDEFTRWHKSVCEKLKTENSNYKNLTHGQAQKWLNMTLKYLYVLGEERVGGISLNYEYFHIPIDNIIQEQILLDLKSIEKKQFQAWSRMESYDEYLIFQKQIIEKYKNRIPMDVEFELFNKGITNSI